MRDGRLTLIRWGAEVLCVGLVAGLYGPTLGYPLIFDDGVAVVKNVSLERVWAWPGAWLPPGDTPLSSRPVSNFSLALTFALSGREAWGHRLGNVLLHALGAVVLLLGVERAARLGGVGRWWAVGAAGVAAAVWAAHPLTTEAVVYVTQRTELMVSVCGMGAVALLLGSAGRSRGVGRALLSGSVVCCGLAMGSKELAVGLPVVLWMADRGLMAGTWWGALRARWGYYVGLALTWGVLAGSMAASGRGKSAGFDLGVSAWSYLLTQAEVLVHYGVQVVWPTDLRVAYDWPIAGSWVEVWWQGLVVAGLLVATGWAVVWRKRWGWAAAWVWVWLGPTSSVVPIVTEVAADRRMYLPLALIVGLAAVGLAGWLGRGVGGGVSSVDGVADPGQRPPELALPRLVWVGVALLAAGLVVACAVGSAARLTVYSDAELVWRDAIAKGTDTAGRWYALGQVLLEKGELVESEAAYRRSLELDGAHWKSMQGIGAVMAATGRGEQRLGWTRRAVAARVEPILGAEGAARLVAGELDEAAYRAGVEVVATYPSVLTADTVSHLGGYWVEAGRLERGLWTLERAAAVDAASADVWSALGGALLRAGRAEAAIEALGRAEGLGGLDARGTASMGLAMLEAGRAGEAEGWLRRAVSMEARLGVGWRGLSAALRRQGRLGEAIDAAERGVEVEPMSAASWNGLGIALATGGRLADAEAAWRRAVELEPGHPGATANLRRLMERR
ncbi:MAG: tetratricopeptide repeat protein [Planctomycetota bacterium]